jgi:hypothetical protein
MKTTGSGQHLPGFQPNHPADHDNSVRSSSAIACDPTLQACAMVRASHGLAVAPDGTLDGGFDWLVVAGGFTG